MSARKKIARAAIWLALAIVLAPSIPSADAGLTLTIGNRSVVTGELDPADETDMYRVHLPAGARVKGTLTVLKPANGTMAFVPALSVTAADGTPIANGLTKGRRARLGAVTAPATGVYLILVSGDGVNIGEYKLAISWKNPKKAGGSVDLGAAVEEITFSAEAGTIAKFKVKSARKSDARPRLMQVVAGDFQRAFAPASSNTAKSHNEKGVLLPETATYTLHITNAVVDAGKASASIKLKSPKAKRALVIATGETITPVPDGLDDEVFGEVIDPRGGELIAGNDDGSFSILDGASLLVPAGAISLPVVLFVRPDADIDSPDPQLLPRGPALFFGPDGTTFDEEVLVALPFDATEFAGDFSDLVVLERNAGGIVTEVDRNTYQIDLGPPTRVLFPISHFTTFQAFGPEGARTIFEDDFESGLGDWNVTNGIWEVGLPTSGPGFAVSGANVAATVLAGNYPDKTDSRLVSPPIVLPGLSDGEYLEVRYQQWFAINGFDCIELEVAEDLQPLDWQRVTTDSDASGVWSETAYDLSAFAGKTIRIGFRLNQTNVSGTGRGWYLDDVSVSIRRDIDLADEGAFTWGFENGFEDWWSSRGLWEIGAPTSGPGSARTGTGVAATELAGNYTDRTTSALFSPPFVLPDLANGETLRLTFWHFFGINGFDGAEFGAQVKSAPGTWEPRVVLSTHQGSSGVWTRSLFDVSEYAGSTVRFDFLLRQTAVSGTSAGWYIDDFLLEHRKP